jgi:hypothetical protein
MSTKPPPKDDRGWPEMTPEEREELRRDFEEAREALERGDPGIPMDEVLPRYRKTG